MARNSDGGQNRLRQPGENISQNERDFFLSFDTPLDRVIHRPPARLLASLLKDLPVSPNAVTVSSLAPAALAAWYFARGNPAAAAAGLVGFYLWALLDHADGELARLKGAASAFGKKLDDLCDAIASNLMLAGIFTGLLGCTPEKDSPLVIAAFVVGLLLNVACGELVTRTKRRYRESALREERADGAVFQRQKLLDHFTGREPFYILIVVLIAALVAGNQWAGAMAAFLIGGTYSSAAASLVAWFRMSF